MFFFFTTSPFSSGRHKTLWYLLPFPSIKTLRATSSLQCITLLQTFFFITFSTCLFLVLFLIVKGVSEKNRTCSFKKQSDKGEGGLNIDLLIFYTSSTVDIVDVWCKVRSIIWFIGKYPRDCRDWKTIQNLFTLGCSGSLISI